MMNLQQVETLFENIVRTGNDLLSTVVPGVRFLGNEQGIFGFLYGPKNRLDFAENIGVSRIVSYDTLSDAIFASLTAIKCGRYSFTATPFPGFRQGVPLVAAVDIRTLNTVVSEVLDHKTIITGKIPKEKIVVLYDSYIDRLAQHIGGQEEYSLLVSAAYQSKEEEKIIGEKFFN